MPNTPWNPAIRAAEGAPAHLRVTDYERMGKLVITWATGANALEDGNAYPIPRSLAELQQQLRDANVGASLSDDITRLVVVAEGEQTLVLRVPSAGHVKEMIDAAGGRAWELPGFYDERYVAPAQRVPDYDYMKLSISRIGEYSITNCA